FGGMDTEISPPDCPNGISPLCSDMEFTPGSVISRRALRRLYSARPSTTVTSLGQFEQPNGDKINLVMYSVPSLYITRLILSPFGCSNWPRDVTVVEGRAEYRRRSARREITDPGVNSMSLHSGEIPFGQSGGEISVSIPPNRSN